MGIIKVVGFGADLSEPWPLPAASPDAAGTVEIPVCNLGKPTGGGDAFYVERLWDWGLEQKGPLVVMWIREIKSIILWRMPASRGQIVREKV